MTRPEESSGRTPAIAPGFFIGEWFGVIPVGIIAVSASY